MRGLKREDFFQRYKRVSPEGLVLWLDQSDVRSYGDTQNWKDISGLANDIEQITGANQPTIEGALGLAGVSRTFDGDDFMHQKVYNKETDCGNTTFWPTYAGACFDANNARIAIRGAFDPDNVALGSDLVTDGDMSNAASWNEGGSWDVDATVADKAYCTGVGGSSDLSQAIVASVGIVVKITFIVSNSGIGNDAWFTMQEPFTAQVDSNGVALRENGTHTIYGVVEVVNSIKFRVYADTPDGESIEVDDVSVEEVTNAGLSAFASAANDYMLVIHDSSDKTAFGYIDVADSAETPLGSEMWDGPAAIFTSGIYSWVTMAGNTIANDNNTLKITHVDNSWGAYVPLNNAADLNADLTVGQLYKVQVDAKVDGGTCNMCVYLGSAPIAITGPVITETSFTTKTMYFTADHVTDCVLQVLNMSGGQILWYDNLTIKPVTHVGTDGTLIMSTKGGSTQSWAYQEAGINLNAIDSFEVLKSDFQITGDLSVFMWVKPDDGRPFSNEYVLSKWRNVNGFRSFSIQSRATGAIKILFSSDGADNGEDEITVAPFFADGQETWHQIGFVYAAGASATCVIYGDGVPLDSSTDEGGIPAALFDVSEKLTIGALSTPGNYFAGLKGSTILFKREVSSAEALKLFQVDRSRFGV